MPIQEQNIVFVKSQVMDDVPEGGGAATGIVIPDGVMNNVFEDISDLARAYGQLNLRKVFLAVREVGTSLYGGVKTVITALPTDPALSYTLFTTNDPFDVRTDAADKIEAYLYKGPMWPGALYDQHIAGMRSISLLQRVGSELPVIGKTLCLVQDEGLAQEKEQYVRVIKVTVTQRTFAGANGEFIRWEVRLDLSDALRHNFTGHVPLFDDRYDYTGKTRIRDTTVADATRYYSSQPVAVSASVGDLSIQAKSLFAQLVPSTQTETPLVNQLMAPELVVPMSAGSRDVDVYQAGQTRSQLVTAENRRLNWIERLKPLPSSGVLSVAYRAQGSWYTLLDDGEGVLAGSDPQFGAGTVNGVTGDVSVTLGALPDVGSLVIWTWGSQAHYRILLDNAAPFATFTCSLTSTNMVLTATEFSWTAGGSPQTATVDAAGEITGAATGQLTYNNGWQVTLILATLPDRGTPLTMDSTQYDGPSEFFATYPSGFPITLAHEPLKVWISNGMSFEITGTDLVLPEQIVHLTGGQRATVLAAQTVGTWDAVTFTLTVTAAEIMVAVNKWDVVEKEWVLGDEAPEPFPATLYIVYTVDPAVVGDPLQETVTITELNVALLPTVTDALVGESLRFTLGGWTYEDRAGSTLVTQINATTGAGTGAGTVNLASGDATVTYWANGGTAAVAVTSLLSRYGQWTTTEAVFRAAASPLKPEALTVFAQTPDGASVTGSGDEAGLIVGSQVSGAVHYEFGTAQVTFALPVDPTTITYNAVAYAYLPLDATILGIDAVRLPSDGRVPIYRAGDVVQILHPGTTTGTPTLNGGTGTYDLACGRTRLAFVKVVDATGVIVSGDTYTLDRASGVVAFTTLAGVTTPVTITHAVGDLRLVTDAQINGTLTLARELSHDFPADESLVAACLIHGDRRARVSAVWDQASWNSTWIDYLVGTAATATLNTIDFPVTVTNEGCDTDRWLLRFLSTTTAELISEKRGLVWTGSFPAYVSGDPVDIAPINPRTRDYAEGVYTGGLPYLTIPQRANGGGWAAGNVVRINTVGAIADFWIARSIGQSDEPEGTGADGCELYALGNIDRP